MAQGDARVGKWRGNWRMQWVASTLHTTLEHGVSNITTADAHTSAASSRLNWRPRRFTWTRTFRRKMKSGFCTNAITFRLVSKTRFKAENSAFFVYRIHFWVLYWSRNKERLSFIQYSVNWFGFIILWKLFTTRYGLGLQKKNRLRFVFDGLNNYSVNMGFSSLAVKLLTSKTQKALF